MHKEEREGKELSNFGDALRLDAAAEHRIKYFRASSYADDFFASSGAFRPGDKRERVDFPRAVLFVPPRRSKWVRAK
jgi:hypothetical protein